MNFSNEITDYETLRLNYCYRDGFVFTSISEPANIYDAILIRNPISCNTNSPILGFSNRSLDEHIVFINKHKISKAIVIAENLEFITNCPSLEHLVIIPSNSDGFSLDYSPLYKMRRIFSLDCYPCFNTKQPSLLTVIDCSKISELRKLWVRYSGVINYENINSLEELYLYDCKKLSDLRTIGGDTNLKKLSCISCGLKSLNGIENLKQLQWFDVSYCKTLYDINMLSNIHESLRMLSIESCSRISDFSCLSHLDKIEFLELLGNNAISNLDFISVMHNLQLFSCTMNIVDGNISPCLSIPYADLKNRKHYNFKNAELSKIINPRGFQFT